MEICTLDKDIYGLIRNTRILTTIYTSDTHRSLGRANHKIVRRKRALNAIERYKLLTIDSRTNNNLSTLNLIGIEGVQRLT